MSDPFGLLQASHFRSAYSRVEQIYHQNNCTAMQQDPSHTHTAPSHKFSIRKNKQVMRMSKNSASRDVHQSKEMKSPPPHNNRAKQLEMRELNYTERFIFNQDKSEVNYECGCLSLPNYTKSQIYISPSQVISRRLLQQGRDFLR